MVMLLKDELVWVMVINIPLISHESVRWIETEIIETPSLYSPDSQTALFTAWGEKGGKPNRCTVISVCPVLSQENITSFSASFLMSWQPAVSNFTTVFKQWTHSFLTARNILTFIIIIYCRLISIPRQPHRVTSGLFVRYKTMIVCVYEEISGGIVEIWEAFFYLENIT